MAMFENVRLALQSLRANPLRSALTLIGIAVGIAAVLYVVVLGEITQRRINQQLESLGSNVLMIRPGFGHRGHVRTEANVVNLTWNDALEIEAGSKVISTCVPTYSGGAMAEYNAQNYSTRVTGTTPIYEDVDNSHPVSGRFFNESEVIERSQVCVLGATVATELFGNEDPVGKSITLKSKRFEVVGLLAAKGEGWSSPDDQVFVPLTTAQERLYGTDYLSSILAQIKSADDYDEALFDIEYILRRNHRLRPDEDNDFRVHRQDFFLSTIQDTNEELANFIILIAFISLVVGGIGIANVMLVSVTERIREIGVRRAIGARKVMITIQFLVEAVVLGLVGGLLGIGAGMAINKLVIGAGLIFPWFWMANSLGICVTIGVLSGLYPAVRAANINVIEALRHE